MVTLGPGDLVLCSGTLPPQTSFPERVAAGAAGGFAGISIWARDYAQARDAGLTDADLRALLDDHGMAIAELDSVWGWLPGAGRSVAPDADPGEFFRYGESDLYRIADAIGSRSLNAVDVFGGDWGIDDAAAAFASLCDRAAEHGLLVHVEFLPWSRIPDVGTAWEVARRADRPNGGIAVDSWHFFRGTPDWDALRAVPGDHILGVQLSDAPAEPEADLVAATLHERRLPGHGELDLAPLVRTLVEMAANAPIGVEVFSDALGALSPVEIGRRAGAATRDLLTESGFER